MTKEKYYHVTGKSFRKNKVLGQNMIFSVHHPALKGVTLHILLAKSVVTLFQRLLKSGSFQEK